MHPSFIAFSAQCYLPSVIWALIKSQWSQTEETQLGLWIYNMILSPFMHLEPCGNVLAISYKINAVVVWHVWVYSGMYIP